MWLAVHAVLLQRLAREITLVRQLDFASVNVARNRVNQ